MCHRFDTAANPKNMVVTEELMFEAYICVVVLEPIREIAYGAVVMIASIHDVDGAHEATSFYLLARVFSFRIEFTDFLEFL